MTTSGGAGGQPPGIGRHHPLIYRTNFFSPTLANHLGWGVPDMVVTSDLPGVWFGCQRRNETGLKAPV